jgi:hypothetical protein
MSRYGIDLTTPYNPITDSEDPEHYRLDGQPPVAVPQLGNPAVEGDDVVITGDYSPPGYAEAPLPPRGCGHK